MMEKNYTDILVDLSGKIGELGRGLEDLKTHFTNHVSQHTIDKVLQAIYFGLTVAMFCFLRFGK